MSEHVRNRKATRRASTRPVALIVVLLAVLFAAAACGPRGGLSDRYVAEKLAWRARMLRRAMAENPDMATDEMRDRLAAVYKEIIRLFPPPGEGVEPSGVQLDVARISGMSRLRLASLLEQDGESTRAQRLYASVADGYGFSRTMVLDASSRLAASYQSAGEHAAAAAVLLDMAGAWEPAGAGGAPDPRVVRAPLEAAGNLVAGGGMELPEALEMARAYYREWVSEWSGTDVAAAALGVLAESYEMEARWSDAILHYERLDREYGATERRAAIWLKLGDLYSARMDDTAKAAEYYRAVEATCEDEPEGGAASISLSRFDIEAGRYEEARARLESVVSSFAGEEALAATATQHLAMVLELEGRLETAIARYGELSTSYPTSLYGLAAPLKVAEIYEEMEEEQALELALERASEHYERIIRDYEGSPAELAARSHLLTVRRRLEDWPGVAELLLDTASVDPDDPASASMMLQAAEIHATRLSDPDGERAILRDIASTYEGTPAGDEAQRRLAAAGLTP